MTEKLYLRSIESGYNQHFNATVTEVEEHTIVLDQTLFYPLGGWTKLGYRKPNWAKWLS